MRGRALAELSPAEAARQLSSKRLRGILVGFVTTLIIVGSGGSSVLVWLVLQQFNQSVEADLKWKAQRGAREIAGRGDVAIALGDAKQILEGIAEYRSSTDVQAVVVVDPQGRGVAQHGSTHLPIGSLFSGNAGGLAADDDSVWSWYPARIEGQDVGRVALVISKQRLNAGFHLRNRMMMLAAIACVVGIFISLFFVNSYLAPLLRFTQRTLDELRELNITLEKRVTDRTGELSRANNELAFSLEQLNATQAQLLDASRRAGMADVATTVLHNVGNVLNSVNVSSEMLAETIRNSSSSNLDRVGAMLRERGETVGDFLANDPKGKKIPAFIIAMADAIRTERGHLADEVEALRENVEHIKQIVSRQQELAKDRVGVVDKLPICDLLDAVAKMVSPSFDKRGIELVDEYSNESTRVSVDRHKIVEVMLNLLTNAQQAVEDQQGSKRVVIRARAHDSTVFIEVRDNGYGIAPEILGRIFEQHFTTKREGHGLGLHGSACHMIEMGGKLRAHSEGPGKGSTFTVELNAAAPSQPDRRSTVELLAVR